jgi:hypothetical protein
MPSIIQLVCYNHLKIFFFQVLVRVPNMHGFVVTSLAFAFAKSNAKDTTDKGKSMDRSREALLSISADKSCCATTVTGSKGMLVSSRMQYVECLSCTCAYTFN